MASVARNMARAGAAHLRAVLVLLVVAAMLLSAFPGHAAHEITEDFATPAAVADDDSGDDGADAALDCAVHPGCQAVTLPLHAEAPTPVAMSHLRPWGSTSLPGIHAPPLPQPPQFS